VKKFLSICLILAVLIFMTGCDMFQSKYKLSPPEFFQGKFLNTDADLTITITSDNFIVDLPSLSLNLKNMIATGDYKVTESTRDLSTTTAYKGYYIELSSNGYNVKYGIEFRTISSAGSFIITTMGMTQRFDVEGKYALDFTP